MRGDGTGYVRARIRGALECGIWTGRTRSCNAAATRGPMAAACASALPGPDPAASRCGWCSAYAPHARADRVRNCPPISRCCSMGAGCSQRWAMTSAHRPAVAAAIAVRTASTRTGPNRGAVRAWRIEARGFCVEPANDVAGHGRIVVSRFDFAGSYRVFRPCVETVRPAAWRHRA